MPQFNLDQGFRLGLRHTAEAARNGQTLKVCDNVKPSEQGLVPWTNGMDAVPVWLQAGLFTYNLLNVSLLALNNQFPQIYNGRAGILAFGSDRVLEVNDVAQTVERVYPTAFNPTNLVTNGTFDTDIAGWTLSAPGAWAWATGGWAKSTTNGYMYQACLTISTPSIVTLTAYGPAGSYIAVSKPGGDSDTRYLTTVPRNYQFYLDSETTTQLRIYASAADVYVDDVRAYTAVTIPTDGISRWHIADFGPVLLACNGSCTLLRVGLFDGSHSPYQYHWYIDTTLNPRTMCNIGGRLVMGGFSGAPSYSSWITSALSAVGLTNVEKHVSDLGSSHVWWSCIGGDDILRLFNPTYETAGPNADGTPRWSATEPWFESTDLLNQAGHKRIPYDGIVRNIRQLGGGLVVYTDKGVGYLEPVMAGGFPTFSFQHLVEVGVLHRGAVGGNDDKHYFVDTRGTVWGIGRNLQPTRLGYEEYLSTLVPATYGISTHYHADRDEVYFSSKDSTGAPITFIVTPEGLARATYGISAIALVDGDWVTVVAVNGVDGVAVETDVFDFGNRGVDTLKAFEVGATAQNMTMTLYYRTNKNGAWSTRTSVNVARNGKQTLLLSAADFRARFTTATITDFTQLEYVTILFEPSGRKQLGQLLRSA